MRLIVLGGGLYLAGWVGYLIWWRNLMTLPYYADKRHALDRNMDDEWDMSLPTWWLPVQAIVYGLAWPMVWPKDWTDDYRQRRDNSDGRA